MSAFLFVHFKEKYTPDGEQIYFGLSKNGFVWEEVNGGEPVLETHLGDCGVRDHAIMRKMDGSFVILATDLSLANHFEGKYHGSWEYVS
ncbi:MAG: 1,4-beta-xylanase, partial [Butyrivibrio sp.]|nr:1,4-beta-xylanase [Butyrivibrio sp.]